MVTEREFAKWNVWFLPLLSTVASATVLGVVYGFGGELNGTTLDSR